MNIDEIKIDGLFGETNYSIRPKDNKLILVAENGSGKTTLVNIIYYLLSGQWHKLRLFKFDSITGIIDGVEMKIRKSELV